MPALLDSWQIPYVFSDPLSCAVTLHKGIAKHVVRGHGLATPDFAVISAPDEIRHVRLRFPLFAKPVAEGTGKGISTASRASSSEELAAVCGTLLAQYRQPVLVEEFLPGREFTVGMTGTGASAGAIGTMEVHLGPKADPGVYTFDNKEHWEGRVTYSLLTEEPLRHRGRRRLPSQPGGPWGVVMAGGWTSGLMQRACPASLKPIPWQACIPDIRICRSSAASRAFLTTN